MTWAERLTRATAIVDRLDRLDLSSVPPWYADQMQAANRHTKTTLERFGAELRQAEPDRTWTWEPDLEPTREQKIHLLAAALDVESVCCHLRSGGPMPAHVRLALHRADCSRCIATVRKPPAGEADRCDFCGQRDIVIFFPMALAYAHFMLIGDGCANCAAVLKTGAAA